MNGCFVTGTDTGVGKTIVSAGLLHLLAKNSDLNITGMKPVASGCEVTKQGLRNEDALMIMQESNIEFDYEMINPYAFEPPISPHFAAAQADKHINLDDIAEKFSTISTASDFVLVEGVGGWQVPLNEQDSVADLAVKLQLPIILVVGLRLGCINHALLTAQAIRQKGLTLSACVASQIDVDYKCLNETIETLEQRLDLPVDLMPNLDQVNAVRASTYLTRLKQQIYENI